jgi:hypothetical protein
MVKLTHVVYGVFLIAMAFTRRQQALSLKYL